MYLNQQRIGVSSPAARLRADIEQAQSWEELETLCGRIDGGFRQGELDLETAEVLGRLVVVVARSVPQEGSAGLEEAEDGCPCCGQAAWWENCGRLVCGVCHPRPQQQVRARQAA